jgi:hypothetical protein
MRARALKKTWRRLGQLHLELIARGDFTECEAIERASTIVSDEIYLRGLAGSVKVMTSR